jgi:hypothetical protein
MQCPMWVLINPNCLFAKCDDGPNEVEGPIVRYEETYIFTPFTFMYSNGSYPTSHFPCIFAILNIHVRYVLNLVEEHAFTCEMNPITTMHVEIEKAIRLDGPSRLSAAMCGSAAIFRTFFILDPLLPYWDNPCCGLWNHTPCKPYNTQSPNAITFWPSLP